MLLSSAFCDLAAAPPVAPPPLALSNDTKSSPASKSSQASAPADEFLPPVPPREWRTIVLHHSATSGGSVESIDAVHRQQRDSNGEPWLGIGYHFVIGNGQQMGDGEVRTTFRWQRQLAGAHAGKRQYNEQGIGICLIGNFDDAAPTEKQVAAIRSLLATLSKRYTITRERVVRHRDVQTTLCPGRLFPWEQALSDVPSAKTM